MIEPRKLIIDTDPGVDDAIALFMALSSPELDVIGLTTVFGNASVDVTTRNAHTILHAAGRNEVPVAQGSAAPLAGPYAGPIPHIHGHDGLGDGGIVGPAAVLNHPQSAAAFLCTQINAAPGKVHVLTLGPLTNLALALSLDPSLAEKTASLTIMGGNALCPGNATPCAEANLFSDPEAGDIVLGERWPVAMIGLDVTQRIVLASANLDAICAGQSPKLALLRSAMPCYRRFYKDTNGIDGLLCHDPSAVAYLLRPDLFNMHSWPLRVETQGLSRGKTWPDCGATDHPAQPWQDRPKIKVAIDADNREITNLVLARM